MLIGRRFIPSLNGRIAKFHTAKLAAQAIPIFKSYQSANAAAIDALDLSVFGTPDLFIKHSDGEVEVRCRPLLCPASIPRYILLTCWLACAGDWRQPLADPVVPGPDWTQAQKWQLCG